MSVQSMTSADKKLQAQEARQRASVKSASNRRVRKKPVVVAGAVSPTPVKELGGGDSSSTIGSTSATVVDTNLNIGEVNGSDGSELDSLCEIVDSNPSVLGQDLNSVRQLCRNRRKALSSKGKAAVPRKRQGTGSSGSAARAMAYAAGKINGRDLARIRREEMANIGRGDAPAGRPSGRIKPKVPPKVEAGTTLSGQEVTGTQVERSIPVTGNESGSCRPVTGTEYVSSEQFETFCGEKPNPNPPKVGMSVTGSGRPVSGTEVGRSEKVTGDEHGSCASVTGSEYIGADMLAKFCGTKPSAKPAKVISSRTEVNQNRLTGSDEARTNATTGNEAGSQHAITGSQYADTGAAKMTINGPSKVALTHTIAGQPVTGTEVGRSASVTGDEYGSCRPVTGTEYISNEQYKSICGTIAEPHPAKVGVDNSRQNQRITGALVDRSENVTGNEPGSCSRLTGTQYGESKLCGGVAPKVHDMHTLSGRHLTGNSVDLSPKMTGDEQAGCLPVTGTEYYGQEQFAQCPSTPQAAPAKVGIDHTPKGEHVSGTMVGATGNVTGNEHGAQLPVSGTPYSGIQSPQNHGSCCDACAIRDVAQAAGLLAPVQSPAPQATYVQQPVVAPAPQHPLQYAVLTAPPAASQDFSIVSPARGAQLTGSQYGGGRVTGPGNMAANQISGTPEFRYPEVRQLAAPAPAPVLSAPELVAPPQPQQLVAQQSDEQIVHSQRITGEGREDGIPVTGDNWGRSPGMTGTEGHVAQGRNPSLRRGEMHRSINNAHHNKELERPDVSFAAVTGSSGNTHDGAVITVSGGARG